MAVTIRYNYSLLGHNTFGMNVRAARFISYGSVNELKEVLNMLCKEQPMLHIGQGSNLLFTKDFEGTILHSEIRFTEIEAEEDEAVFVRVGSGVIWDDFCDEMAKNNYYGVENLSYIPGEVGAAAVQNIGAYGVEACETIKEVATVERATGRERIFVKDECRYGYRDSIFKNELRGKYIVTAVLFRLSTKPAVHLDYGQLRDLRSSDTVPSAGAIRQAVIRIRQNKLPDPATLGNAGSFFKNPIVPVGKYNELAAHYAPVPHYMINEEQVKIPAAWLIEQCGWKGKKRGGAAVYGQQPLIIVNQHRAEPEDIIRLAAAIGRTVYDKFQIHLYPEVNYI